MSLSSPHDSTGRGRSGAAAVSRRWRPGRGRSSIAPHRHRGRPGGRVVLDVAGTMRIGMAGLPVGGARLDTDLRSGRADRPAVACVRCRRLVPTGSVDAAPLPQTRKAPPTGVAPSKHAATVWDRERDRSGGSGEEPTSPARDRNEHRRPARSGGGGIRPPGVVVSLILGRGPTHPLPGPCVRGPVHFALWPQRPPPGGHPCQRRRRRPGSELQARILIDLSPARWPTGVARPCIADTPAAAVPGKATSTATSRAAIPPGDSCASQPRDAEGSPTWTGILSALVRARPRSGQARCRSVGAAEPPGGSAVHRR